MKTKSHIFREAERLTQNKYGKMITMALYGDLMIAGGFMKEGDDVRELPMDGVSERLQLSFEYDEWLKRSQFQRAIEDLLDEEGQT